MRSFRVQGTDPIRLVGVIDEDADLRFFSRVTSSATISLAGVRRINSDGVRRWIDALRGVRPDVRLRFIECPPQLVDQLNMLSGFLGAHDLESFYAPMECDSCGGAREELICVTDIRKNSCRLPVATRRCESCGGEMLLGRVEEQYLLFLRED